MRKDISPDFLIANLLLLRFNALGNFAPLQKHGELSAYLYVINVFPLFMQYLETWPFYKSQCLFLSPGDVPAGSPALSLVV